MPCSPARLAANRENARKSTGPRTPEGKAASRQNATRHGLAASEDLIGPLDDAGLVAARADALADEWGAPGATGRLLARRAALLSTRMERLAERDEAETRARMARAVAEADAPRARVLDRLIAELIHVGPERPLALRTLWASPDGVDRVLGFADDLVAELVRGDDPAAEASRRALGWLDPGSTLPEPAEPDGSTPPDPTPGPAPIDIDELLARVAAEVARWEARSLDLAPERARLDAERRRVALGAAFDPGPEAHSARRYEAAAERGFYRAFGAIRQLRRDLASAPVAAPATPEPVPAAPPDPAPVASAPTADQAPPDPADAAARPLGSFRAEEGSPPVAVAAPNPMVLPRPPVPGPARRRGRPDPLRLVASHR